MTGGKQYKVKEGDSLKIEKLDIKEGAAAVFDKVLFYQDSKKTEIGRPFLPKVKVQATVLKTAKAKKITVIKFKAKVRYRRKRGHRQLYTLVKIEKISSED